MSRIATDAALEGATVQALLLNLRPDFIPTPLPLGRFEVDTVARDEFPYFDNAIKSGSSASNEQHADYMDSQLALVRRLPVGPDGSHPLTAIASRRTPVYDCAPELGLLNLVASEPTTVIGEVVSAPSWSSWFLDDLGPHYDERSNSATGIWNDAMIPAELRESTRKELELLAARSEDISQSRLVRLSAPLQVALEQVALGNDELWIGRTPGPWARDALLRLVIAVEAAVGGEKEAVTRTITQRAAILAGPAQEDVQRARNVVADAYKLRSRYVHGDTVDVPHDTLARVRDVVSAVLRNWIIVAAVFAQRGESIGSMMAAVDDALIQGWSRDLLLYDHIGDFQRGTGLMS